MLIEITLADERYCDGCPCLDSEFDFCDLIEL